MQTETFQGVNENLSGGCHQTVAWYVAEKDWVLNLERGLSLGCKIIFSQGKKASIISLGILPVKKSSFVGESIIQNAEEPFLLRRESDKGFVRFYEFKI